MYQPQQPPPYVDQSGAYPPAPLEAQLIGPPVVQEASAPVGDIPAPAFLDTPSYVICPNCSYQGPTQVDRVRGCCSFWCCLFSCCCDCWNDFQHSCPQCKMVLGTYQAV